MNLAHIDTCLGCYLTDHHNRPGELLLGCYVTGRTTYADIKSYLMSEVSGFIDREDWTREHYGQAREAIGAAFSPVRDLHAAFDDSLDIPGDEQDDDGSEPVQAWFLLTWEVPEGDDLEA